MENMPEWLINKRRAGFIQSILIARISRVVTSQQAPPKKHYHCQRFWQMERWKRKHENEISTLGENIKMAKLWLTSSWSVEKWFFVFRRGKNLFFLLIYIAPTSHGREICWKFLLIKHFWKYAWNACSHEGKRSAERKRSGNLIWFSVFCVFTMSKAANKRAAGIMEHNEMILLALNSIAILVANANILNENGPNSFVQTGRINHYAKKNGKCLPLGEKKGRCSSWTNAIGWQNA